MNKKLKALTALETIMLCYEHGQFEFAVIHIDLYDHNKKLIAKVYGNPWPDSIIYHMSYFTIPVDDNDYSCKCGDERSCCIHSLLKIAAKTRHMLVTTTDGSVYEIPILAWRGGNVPKKKIYDPEEERDQDEIMHVTYIGRKDETTNKG